MTGHVYTFLLLAQAWAAMIGEVSASGRDHDYLSRPRHAVGAEGVRSAAVSAMGS
jgi:hypothetical protein